MSTTTRGKERRAARSAGQFAGFLPNLLATIPPARGSGNDTTQTATLDTDARRATPWVSARRVSARRAAAAWVAVAVAAGGFGSLVVAQPAHAATAEADVEARVGGNTVQGKVGAKVAVGYQITNHGKIDVGVAVTIQAPRNAEIESAAGCAVGGNRRIASCQIPALKAGASVNGSFQLVLRTAGEDDSGDVTAKIATQKVTDPKPGNNGAGFKTRVTGASATPSASKSTRASRSASADPTGTSDEVIAPPEAGNGAIPRDDPKTQVSNDTGGLSFGFWIGVVAIVAALGLVGSLFYFRRKDRLEPDTGVFNLPTAGRDNPTSVITPGVYGSPAAAPAGPAFQNAQNYGGQGYGQGFQPGQGAPGASGVYGAQAAPPVGPPLAGPPPAGPPAPAPGANDQTIIMRRPDDL
ncbi:hypothetical protein AB0K00_23285 [Dactylosporangium sp. NPDC049525]|uniref:hypothetical protein n=1 Tax=Dactylosporangium sp. NPDC049525 TaxID=3154730 RepID=UPI003436AD95